MQRIIISVTNDLVTDQRINKVCQTLLEANYEIVLIGRKLSNSTSINKNYKTIRMRLLFNKGFLFYAEYNTRLFFKLLFLKKDILLANDLDTLLPNYINSKIFSKKLVYDSHELFTEVPELNSKPIIRNFWLKIEKYILPKLKNIYTVNDKIANFYSEKYNIRVKVIRNFAPKLYNQSIDKNLSKSVKGAKKMLIIQGTGINMDRGAEEAVMMMRFLDNMILYIIGSGDIIPKLIELIEFHQLGKKVIIKDKMPYQELLEYTKIADLGLSLDKNTNLNYEFSLPNKVFDYIQCQIPILTSNRLIIADLVSKNSIGYITETHDPEKLARIVNSILNDDIKIKEWKSNLKKVALEYTWEKESKKIKQIFENLE